MPDRKKPEPEKDDIPVPPKIIDQLMVDVEPEDVTPPPKTVGISEPPAEADKPILATTSESAGEADAPQVWESSSAALTRRQRAFLLGGVGITVTVNILLVILVVLMARERIHMNDLLPARGDGSPHAESVETDPRISPVDDERKDSSSLAPTGLPSDLEQIAQTRALHKTLEIPKLVLTRGVNGFGNYDPLHGTTLTAQNIPFVEVYVEIANPKHETRNDDRYIYHLTKYMKLFSSGSGPGEPLMDSAISLVKGGGTSPMRDIFSSQRLQPQQMLEPGEYTLTVRIADHVSGETATAETSFVVVENQ